LSKIGAACGKPHGRCKALTKEKTQSALLSEAIGPLLQGADHVDVKRVEGVLTLREFLAGLTTYDPAWIRFLYQVRAGFVRVLGMKQPRIPPAPRFTPARVPMKPGAKLSIFTVHAAKEDRFWVGHIVDEHLTAFIGVVVEPIEGPINRFHLFTIVHYNNWKGPVYFNVIRPFHHLVVWRMARAAVQPGNRAAT
jgi:hypothetical protein